MTDPLRQLGHFIREHVDDERRSEDTVREARSRFQMSLMRRRRGRAGLSAFLDLPPTQRWALAAASVMALFAAATWGFRALSSDRALTVALESAETELVGSWVSAEDETKQLSFSDGTVLALHPHTKLRVRETTNKGATVDLGQGGTLARITPAVGAKWQFVAGPFRVRVTGTEFYLSWDPNERVLELALHQGSVLLSGPTVKGERAVRKGQFLRVEVPQEASSASEDTEEKKGNRTDAESKGSLAIDVALPTETPPADASSQDNSGAPSSEQYKNGPGPSTWQKALKEGTPGQAVAAVQAAGQSHVLGSASPGQLWSLSQSARLSGQPELARDALLALRKRHGTRGQTSYLLGKISADQLGATSKAITWFETYLKETPGGPLAEQAMGRLAELQAGTNAGQRAAKRYLEHYPRGSYANFCRSQLR